MRQFKAALDEEKAKIQAAARPAAQAAAQVIYDAARSNVHDSEEAHIFYGKYSKKTGQKYLFYPGDLRRSIYQVYSEDNSSEAKATYHVSWNHKKAPYAHMVEFGTSRAPAHSFLGKALTEKSDAAMQAMRRTFIEKVGS
jgi:HK97 gp10 family phage protein